MRRAPLPDEYDPRIFRVRDGLDAGIRRSRLRASDLERPIWGIRRSGETPGAFLGRLEAFAARLHDGVFFSHVTAARLHGIPVPLALERRTEVHAAVFAPARAPHASGLKGHRLTTATRVVTRRGFRVTAPAETWRDLASMLTLTQLVAAGDRIISRRGALAPGSELRRVAGSGRRRGSGTMRAALELLSTRSESPPESELRVILALSGLPEPRVNYEIVDTETGREARVDLGYAELKFAIEYQGEYHRTRDQWRRDMTRRSRLEARGWYVMELNADDLRNSAELVARIRRVISRRTP